ncbi:hypothetical protein FRC02_001665 [Tulasnella sp. 418]|nr:hypothetical protein FRC02_001665 [Tulasnella sp. 418]
MAPKKKGSAKAAPTGPITDKTPSTDHKDIQWPAVSHKDYLEVEVFEPDQILLIHNFLDPLECKNFAALLDNLPLTVTPAAKKGEADRANDRISIQATEFAKELWAALEPHVSSIPSFQTHLKPPAKPHSLNPNIRLYRYSPGQYFGAHYDDSIKDKGSGAWSEWTLLVYLTGIEDGVEGGQVRETRPQRAFTSDRLY